MVPEGLMKFLRAILFFLATLLIYLGVPLLGWGLGDFRGFFSSAPRLGFALVVGLFSLAVGVQAFSSKQGIRGGKGDETKFVFMIILFYRINDEEAVLHQEFGGVWEAYCNRSWRLLPYIY
jgi:protein-S-isoprenylcysteine O-methyltransferase Ste14